MGVRHSMPHVIVIDKKMEVKQCRRQIFYLCVISTLYTVSNLFHLQKNPSNESCYSVSILDIDAVLGWTLDMDMLLLEVIRLFDAI